MPMPKQNRYTVEDIYALPEGTGAELIAGEMIAMAPAALYRITDKIRGSVVDSLVIDPGSVKQ